MKWVLVSVITVVIVVIVFAIIWYSKKQPTAQQIADAKLKQAQDQYQVPVFGAYGGGGSFNASGVFNSIATAASAFI